MSKPKVYADFHNLDDSNRLRLTCAGTVADLARQGLELQEGLVLTFYMDDADDQGQADELRTDGIVHYDKCDRAWVALVDWSAVRNSSDEGNSMSPVTGTSGPAPAGENGPTKYRSGQHSPTAKLSR
jgi:hypothetical protein